MNLPGGIAVLIVPLVALLVLFLVQRSNRR